MDEVTVSQLLEETADYIEEHGWVQRVSMNRAGNVCLTKALHQIGANHDRINASGAARALYEAIRNPPFHGASTGINLVGWNDTYGRTQQEVLDLVRTVAKEQRILEESDD